MLSPGPAKPTYPVLPTTVPSVGLIGLCLGQWFAWPQCSLSSPGGYLLQDGGSGGIASPLPIDDGA